MPYQTRFNFSGKEDALNVLVSNALVKAESFKDQRSTEALNAWLQVRILEQELAGITSSSSISGGIARAGAVHAALASGDRKLAQELANLYLKDPGLPLERRNKIEGLFK